MDVLADATAVSGPTRLNSNGIHYRMCGHADLLFLVVQRQCADPRGGLLSLLPSLRDAIKIGSRADFLLSVPDTAFVVEAKHCQGDHRRWGNVLLFFITEKWKMRLDSL